MLCSHMTMTTIHHYFQISLVCWQFRHSRMHSVTRTISHFFAFKITHRVILLTRFCKLLTRVATPSGGGGHVPQVPQWYDASDYKQKYKHRSSLYSPLIGFARTSPIVILLQNKSHSYRELNCHTFSDSYCVKYEKILQKLKEKTTSI